MKTGLNSSLGRPNLPDAAARCGNFRRKLRQLALEPAQALADFAVICKRSFPWETIHLPKGSVIRGSTHDYEELSSPLPEPALRPSPWRYALRSAFAILAAPRPTLQSGHMYRTHPPPAPPGFLRTIPYDGVSVYMSLSRPSGASTLATAL
jgi:hypothetical protein